MAEKIVNGEETIALGAWEAGVRVVTSYPGSPSSGVIGELVKLSKGGGIVIQWSANEKVALEVAIGASISRLRSLVGMKAVGLNVALDPLMVANLTGVGAGLVLVVGDDPGAWGSQNEEDSRLLGAFAEIPILEPSSPQEGYEMVKFAFQLSESHQTPVMVRIIREYAVSKGAVKHGPRMEPARGKGFLRERERWISLPITVVPNHCRIHKRLETLAQEFSSSLFNALEGYGNKGIIATGYSYTKTVKALEALPSQPIPILKLGALYPLPDALVERFLERIDEVLVVEENEPFIEPMVRALAQGRGLGTRVYGKSTRHLLWEGEITQGNLSRDLSRFLLGQDPGENAFLEERKPMPSREGLCEGCPYIPAFDTFLEVVKELGIPRPIITCDPGCAVRANLPPYELLDVKYCMGSSISIAAGISLSNPPERVMALVGDSSFFHTAVNALMDAVHHQANILVLVLDNGTTALTGLQPHPGVPIDAFGRPSPAVSIEGVVSSLGISSVRVVEPFNEKETKEAFMDGLLSKDLKVIVLRSPCPLLREVKIEIDI